MLQYSMALIAYTQTGLYIEDLFGTQANCTESIHNFIEKGDTNRIWIHLLNVTNMLSVKYYYFFLVYKVDGSVMVAFIPKPN